MYLIISGLSLMGHNSANCNSQELSFTWCSCTVPQLEIMIRYGSLVSFV